MLRVISKTCVLGALFALGFGVGVRAEADGKPKKTLCAFFNPSGNSKTSYCSPLPLAQAQKECDERLKKQKREGSCDCTDDQDFINGR